MNQGNSGVKEVIQEKQSKHCLVAVGKGSYYPGTGVAKFQVSYSKYVPHLLMLYFGDCKMNRNENVFGHSPSWALQPTILEAGLMKY